MQAVRSRLPPPSVVVVVVVANDDVVVLLLLLVASFLFTVTQLNPAQHHFSYLSLNKKTNNILSGVEFD